MSLKTAFASVLKATRAARGLSQKNLAEVSSRTYISKLERAQCSPTLEMLTALSAPLNLSPLTLIAMTIGAENGQSIKSLITRVEEEMAELGQSGALTNLLVPVMEHSVHRVAPRAPSQQPVRSSHQAEFSFSD